MNRDIESAVKRGRGYWFVDGFGEMAAGGVFAILGAAVILRGAAPRDSLPAWLLATGVDIGLIKLAGFTAAVFAVWWLRDRFTYPRTGYVRGTFPAAQALGFVRNVFLIAVLPLLALAAVFLLVPAARGALASLPAWLPAAMGIFLGGCCYALGEWAGLRRFRLDGMAILLAGIAVAAAELLAGLPAAGSGAALPLEEILDRALIGMGLFTLASGAALFLSGLITFLRYRRENPAPFREDA